MSWKLENLTCSTCYANILTVRIPHIKERNCEMEMTTVTGITCPQSQCRKELTITTQGLLGGVLKQLFFGKIIDRAKREGATITCGNCGHKFYHSPQSTPR